MDSCTSCPSFQWDLCSEAMYELVGGITNAERLGIVQVSVRSGRGSTQSTPSPKVEENVEEDVGENVEEDTEEDIAEEDVESSSTATTLESTPSSTEGIASNSTEVITSFVPADDADILKIGNSNSGAAAMTAFSYMLLFVILCKILI
jgi:hypothetical protein